MKKQVVLLTLTAALASTLSANTDSVDEQIQKIQKQVLANKKKASEARMLANGNHLKFDIDFRTTNDSIFYTLASGKKVKNNSILANRLLVNMKYDAGDNVRFYGTVSYNKAFGATMNTQPNNQFYRFDWITNESLADTSMKLKEAYWLYANDTFLGADMPWTASVGRRPSMNGLGANFREGDKRKSALAHTVNVEFDGASFRWNIDQIIPLEGAWVKLCLGRGLTSAKPRFSSDTYDYATDENYVNSDMIGFIVVPYDNGQYSLHTNYAKSRNMIGYSANSTGQIDMASGFQTQGDLDLATAMFKVEGIGDEISDFLDDTILFVSGAYSKTHPKSGMYMLGSTEAQVGYSAWAGIQTPCIFSDDGRLGIEYNQGSKYWRSVTYGEDSMAGSKIAARGNAIDAYVVKPISKSLSMSLRYTTIKYNYTGSNAFFGVDGTPMTIAQAKAVGYDPVEKADDIRILFRYKY